MRLIWVALAPALLPAAAMAAVAGTDKPVVGPPAAWVQPAASPTDTGASDTSPLRILLFDQQLRLRPNGAEAYNETVVRVQTAQGLGALGTITLPWKPDSGALTVHKLHIVRDGKIIDLLAKGPGFTVLRRENNLENAMLDGVLTAVIQPEGLQVGDILDIATTTQNADPALGGNSEAFLMLGPAANGAHYKTRLIWPNAMPVRWRASKDMPPPRLAKLGAETELRLSLDDVRPQLSPNGAPPRFLLTRLIEATSFASWNDLSALFAPHYTMAATLKPDSPLRAEIARIAGASADPVRRAEAALALTQDKLRYVFLGMNDGNLVPADADATWQRRFADCKGKTAFLLALLHGLGIEAEPALVTTMLGDGLDNRLPEVGLFNHIIVRASIGGRTYWLDGTRTGDTRLADIKVPDFGFALPLRTPGASLERLIVPVPDKPLGEYRLKVDMTAGIRVPAPFHVEEISRGDAASQLHLQLDTLTPDVRQQALRAYFADGYPDVELKSYSAAWNPTTGEETLVMDGLEKHDWQWDYEADHASLGWKADFSRAAGPNADAPFQVAYPAYSIAHMTILLPNAGRGMLNRSADIDRTVAGVEYHRKARLDGGVFTIETSVRAVDREFPAAAAPAAQAALRELAALQPLLGIDHTYARTPQEKKAAIADPQSASDYYDRAVSRIEAKDIAGALADADKMISLRPDNGSGYLLRGGLRMMQRNAMDALPDLEKAVALGPQLAMTHVALGEALQVLYRNDEALRTLDRALAIEPKNFSALMLRSRTHYYLGHYDLALADNMAALPLASGDVARLAAYEARVDIRLAQGQHDTAITDARTAVAKLPKSASAQAVLGAVYARQGLTREAMVELGKAIAMEATPHSYLARAGIRPKEDLAGRRADIAAAIKLDPATPETQEMVLAVELQLGDYDQVISTASKLLVNEPKNMQLLTERGIAYASTGRPRLAEQDFAAVRAVIGANVGVLNSLCQEKAVENVALSSAIEDCDAGLKLEAESPQLLDSRGFVLLRMARYQEAVDSYDRALSIRPNMAEALFGRGLAKRRLGRTAEGNADIAAAKMLSSRIEERYAGYGVTN